MRRIVIVLVAAAIVPLLGAYVMSGLIVGKSREVAFAATRIGNTYDDVVSRFGIPSATDGEGTEFTRYASERGKSPCERRLWFENRWFLDTEAWSVSLDGHGRVVEKYHWISP